METNLVIKKFLPILLLGLLVRTTHTNNVSISEELRHPRVSGRIVKLYSGIKPEPILCSGEGFQADPVDCAVFYRCVRGSNNKYTVFRYQCGPGTVYDPDTEICNHAKSTKRINCGGYTALPIESANDNEIDGSHQEIPSPIAAKQAAQTDQAKNAATSTLSTQKFWPPAEYFTPIASSTYTWITTAKEHLRATRSPIPRQPNPQSGEPCTSDGFMGDGENCRKFYRCVGNGRGGFIRYEFSCSELTIWDDEAQACNHVWAVKKRRCGRGSPEDENKNYESPSTTEDNEVNSKQTIQSQLQISYGSKVNQVQTQISKGSVTQNQTQINYGDRIKEKPRSNVKQNQTQISHGSAVSQTQTQISHGNKGSQTQLQIDHSKESSQSQTQIHETDAHQTSDEGTQPPNNGKPVIGNENNECTESGFMGDSNDCKKFYRCVHNGRGGYIKYEFSCGEGTVWDPNAESCNHAWAVKDCKNKAPSETMVQDSKTTTTTTGKTITADTIPDEDEDVSYGDQNQQPSKTTTVSQNRPLTTTETSKTTQAIEHNDISSSTSASSENVCTSSGFMGDSGDCKKFYRCVDNGNGGYTQYEFSCGEGTVWDTNLEACNHAWAVEKCGAKMPDNNTPDTTTTAIVMQDEQNHSGHPTESNNNVDKPTDSTTSSTTTVKTSTSPTQSSSNYNICTSSGFMGDKNNCKKFYRCVDDGKGGYIRYEFSCGEGTVWDQSIESCNHPSKDNQCRASESATQVTLNDNSTPSSSNSQTASGTEENNQSTTQLVSSDEPSAGLSSDKPPNNEGSCSKEGFFGDAKNCKKFYRCVENQKGGFTKYDFTCGEGTMWDPEISACNHESSVKKGCSTAVNDDTTQQQPVSENDEYAESSSTTELSTQITEETDQHQSISNDKCESEGFFASSANCKMFYRCVDDGKGGYTKYDFACGDGTIWDQNSLTCNHVSSQNKCTETSETNASENTEAGSGTTTQSADSSDPTTSTTKRPNTVNNDQSNKGDQCTSEGFYANSNDCKKFYRCVSNDKGGYTKYDFTCGEGTIWVQEIQACDHDNNMSNCSSQGAVSATSSWQSGPDEQPTTKASSTTLTESTSQSQNNESNDCTNNTTVSTQSNGCKSEGFHPNNNDCRKFYRCVDDGKGGYTKYDFTCGEGTAWDSNIQACNHENEVKNCHDSQEEIQSDPKPTDENSSQTTEEPGTTKTSTTETSSSTGNDKCDKEGYYGDSNDCQKFYRCVDNGNAGLTKYDFTCGDGTIWDQDIQTCNHPGDVQNPTCNKNTTSASTTSEASNGTSSTTEPSSTSSTSSSSSTTTTEGQGSSDCSQSSTQKPQNQKVNCTKAGFYADPDDCKKFYRCVDWDNNGQKFSVYHFDCGEGTIWDPALETCNHEDSVYPPRDCSGTQNQITDESSTTTTTTTTESSTEESTTTEQSTTQQSTTESSTTQEATTSEQTTTEQSTTQKSTTTEKSTTQQSTTEQSTTQKSTTTEQSTTQQSSTTEQTTDQPSTTEQSTTGSTTEKSSTTQSSTTEETTTQQSTTQQDTTTTEQSTTQETTESSTQSSTTEEPTTQESSTTEQATDSTESSTTEQSSSSTTEQISDSTTTEGNQESTTEGSSSGSKDCPETEDDQYLYVCPTSFRRHPRYCNMFYQCTEDNDSHDLDIAVFKCPNNTLYDETKTQCVEEDKTDKKCDGEKAERRRFKRLGINYKEPILASTDSLICPSTGHFPFEKSECSPAFLKCDRTKYGKLRGYVNQCPDGYVYWSISRRCEPKFKVKDCKMTSNDWNGRWEVPIERNNIAT